MDVFTTSQSIGAAAEGSCELSTRIGRSVFAKKHKRAGGGEAAPGPGKPGETQRGHFAVRGCVPADRLLLGNKPPPDMKEQQPPKQMGSMRFIFF